MHAPKFDASFEISWINWMWTCQFDKNEAIMWKLSMVCQMVRNVKVQISLTDSKVLNYIMHKCEKWFTFKGRSKLNAKQGFTCLQQIVGFLMWSGPYIYQPIEPLNKYPFINQQIHLNW